MHPADSPLGKSTSYNSTYSPQLLFPILRQTKREEIGISSPLPFYGYDVWNHTEVSWLNTKGKPVVLIAEIIVPADSPFLIESKSLKLYFNSFNQTKFENSAVVHHYITADLSRMTRSHVTVNLYTLNEAPAITTLNGICVDELDIATNIYFPDANLLKTENEIVTETLHSHLLKSNCPVTHQPDWGSIEIQYTGKKINPEALLQYLISYRQHNEFHEQCIERIFMHIKQHCGPSELTVYGRYTRRGGLDINPLRSSKPNYPHRNPRLARQ